VPKGRQKPNCRQAVADVSLDKSRGHCSITHRIRTFYPRRTSGIPGIAFAIVGAAQEADRETTRNITFEPDVKTMTIILIPILFLTTWLFLLGVGLLLDAGRRVVMESRWRSTSG
jgi:hypothetical protein